MDLDWSLSDQPIFNGQDGIEFGIKGQFVPEGQAEVAPAVTPPAMPYKDPAVSSEFQAFVSDFTLDSFADAFLKTNTFSIWTNHGDVPADSPLQLNTTVIDCFLPGIMAHYGRDKPMDVEYTLSKLHNFNAKENSPSMSFNADIDVLFYVETAANQKEVAIELTLSELYFDFTAIIDGMALKPNIESASLGAILVKSSTFGDLDMTLLTDLLNQGLKEGREPLNTLLQKQSLLVPDKVFGLFGLSDLALKYHDGYLEAGLTPTFIPPASLALEKRSFEFGPKWKGKEIAHMDKDGKVEIIMKGSSEADQGFMQ